MRNYDYKVMKSSCLFAFQCLQRDSKLVGRFVALPFLDHKAVPLRAW